MYIIDYEDDEITATIQESIDRVLATGHRQIYQEKIWAKPTTKLEGKLQHELQTLQEEVASLMSHFTPHPRQIH